ncbi:helix-turn-helix domain-containing protein [Nocardia sp. NPDC051750]|uniref:helix-turn-helix domain-containing protein n=1 Tax=Nocardia sp. NPDC051750 TaxID=3364325 RepID=UPI00378C8609
MDLGERLQSVRKRRGVTQRELAGRSGVSLSYVRKIEQGERDDARVETLRRADSPQRSRNAAWRPSWPTRQGSITTTATRSRLSCCRA